MTVTSMFNLLNLLIYYSQILTDYIPSQISLMVTDYTGHRQTLFPIREINLKHVHFSKLNQITHPDQKLNHNS